MKALRVAALSCCALVLLAPAFPQTPVKSDSILSYSQTADGVDFRTSRGVLSVHFCGEAMLHVVFWTEGATEHPKPWIAQTNWPPVPFTVT